MPNKFFDRNWWKDFVVAILATTVSIVLTFGTSKLIEHNNQKKERRLTALMVMSSIESFARSIDESEEEVFAFTDARADVAIEEGPLPEYSHFMKPHPDKESIDANLDYARQLESLLNQN